jgi:hypothetical protein
LGQIGADKEFSPPLMKYSINKLKRYELDALYLSMKRPKNKHNNLFLSISRLEIRREG